MVTKHFIIPDKYCIKTKCIHSHTLNSSDCKKTSVTLQFLTTFALMVPIVDCSKAHLYYDDLTDEEALICGQTAEFEGFVLQYLDKSEFSILIK